MRLAALLALLLAGCAATPLVATAPVVPSPMCIAANARLRGLEPIWLARTAPGHLTLLCYLDRVDGEPYVVSDTGHYETLWSFARYLARKTHRDVDFVGFDLPTTCAD